MASFLDLAGLTHFKQKLFAELAQKNESVLVTPQTLTAAQQKQALANINALGKTEKAASATSADSVLWTGVQNPPDFLPTSELEQALSELIVEFGGTVPQ